jgi:hypothetical protein
MPFNFGQVTMFDDPNSYKDPVIEALAVAIKMPAFKGVVYQMMGAPMYPITQKEYEVYSRTKSTRNGVIGADWNATSTSGLAIPALYCRGLTVGHQLRVDNEIVVVARVDRAANTIDVQGRGMSGTTAAIHAADTPFMVLGFAIRDIDLKNVEGVSEHTLVRNNYVQTVAETFSWEKSAELDRKGLNTEKIMDVHREEAGLRVATMLAEMAILGVKHRGTTAQSFTTSGLLASLVDRGRDNECPVSTYNADGLPINETMLRAALRQVFDYGSPDAMIMNLANAERFLAFPGASSAVWGIPTNINTGPGDTGLGRQATHYNYNGATLRFVIDSDMPDDKIAIVTSADLKKGWLENDMLRHTEEPALSTREYREAIHGTVGFLIENVGYNHILIENLTV